MKRWIIFCLVFSSIISGVALPPSQPPSPGGFDEQPAAPEPSIELQTESQDVVQVLSPDVEENSKDLEKRVSSLEEKVHDLEIDSGIFSIPFIILLSINITLVVMMAYFFFLHKPGQFQPPQQ